MKVLASVVLGLSVTLAHGWWDVGHQTIGAIAQASMKNEHSIQQMKNIMSYLDVTYNDAHNDELVGDFGASGDERPEAASRTLADAARWPDVIKAFYNVKLFDTWHYVNQKYDPENLDVNNTGCGTDSQVNAVTQTGAFTQQIPNAYQGRETAHWFAHFGTNYLIHILGDLMQPYHTMGRCIMYEGELSQDLGGNRWTLKMPDGSSVNAHALWDSVAYRWGSEFQSEVVKTDPQYEAFGASLMDEISVEFLENEGYNVDFEAASNVTNFEEVLQIWMDESNELAVETYERVPLDSTIDEDTLDWVEQKSKERVVLGGYRLAAYFDGLFSETNFPALEDPITREERRNIMRQRRLNRKRQQHA